MPHARLRRPRRPGRGAAKRKRDAVLLSGVLAACLSAAKGQRRGGNLQRAQRIPSNSLKQIGQSEEMAAVIRGLATTMTFVSGTDISVWRQPVVKGLQR